jgi:hypothetical protein
MYKDQCFLFIKQALYEALIRQEELMAYIDNQERRKFEVSQRYLDFI